MDAGLQDGPVLATDGGVGEALGAAFALSDGEGGFGESEAVGFGGDAGVGVEGMGCSMSSMCWEVR